MTRALDLPTSFAPWWQTVLGVAVLNTVVALSLWLAVPAMGGFGATLLYSQCVGLAIVAVSMLVVRAVIRFGGAPRASAAPIAFIALMLAVAAPVGYVIGHLGAQALLGRPLRFPSGHIAAAAALATVLATGVSGYLIWMRQRRLRDAHAREEAQRHAAEAELRVLRAQLEPHMLFNTLANLRELMSVDAAGAQAMLDELIVYLRGTLAATRVARTPLDAEFAQLGAYLQLMQRRMGARLQWHIDLPAALRRVSVPPMLLQPLVENAIRHGLEPQVGAGSIELRAELEEPATLRLCIADTGRGLRVQAERAKDDLHGAHGGYGLVHVRERLRSIYGDAASLTLQPASPHGVQAVVRIPIDENDRATGAGR